MKIAVVNRFAHAVGGIETYLAGALQALAERGCQVRLWHEYPVPADAQRIVGADVATEALGDDPQAALGAVRAWGPDALFLHGVSSSSFEEQLSGLAPTLILLHAYHGTCISGSKTWTFPSAQVCSRALGPGCLLHYLPHRCGGWSPVTMVASYAQQRRRQRLLRSCKAVATLSEHMRQECIAQGVGPDRVWRLPPFVPPAPVSHQRPASASARPLHLVYVGRMETLKGGQILLAALERSNAARRHQLTVTLAGDGRERHRWEATAMRVSRGELAIRFSGWLDGSACASLLESADLLVVPSVWPEPYGLVGPEAAAAGVPALAFDVGGIREWLTDGVHGRLVPVTDDPAGSLARGLDDCLSDAARLARWGRQARNDSLARTMSAHVDALESALARVAGVPARVIPSRHETSAALA